MSKDDIRKNVQLSVAFAQYAAEHPAVMKSVPKNACIVFASKKYPKLTVKNIDLARREMKKSKKVCFKAVQLKNGWSVSRIAVT